MDSYVEAGASSKVLLSRYEDITNYSTILDSSSPDGFVKAGISSKVLSPRKKDITNHVPPWIFPVQGSIAILLLCISLLYDEGEGTDSD